MTKLPAVRPKSMGINAPAIALESSKARKAMV